MLHQLPDLPFAADALEPVISRETMLYHHDFHHRAYIDNLNKLIEGSVWCDKSLEDLIRLATGRIYNNAAQAWNHSFYWNSLIPGGNSGSKGLLFDEVIRSFGSIKNLKNNLIQASVTLFGSGWAWLVKDNTGSLSIMQGPNAWNPLKEGMLPLLTIDVWEHAYYLDYRNRRYDYVLKIFDLINWEVVEERFIQKGFPDIESSPVKTING